MKKLSVLLAVAVLSLSMVSAVYAESQDFDKAERIRLSKDLHDIRNIRDRINATILDAANSIPPEEREDFQK